MLDFSDAPINGRVEGLKTALTTLNKIKKSDVFIIETGTTRGSLGGGAMADGWATPLFGWYCSKFGGTTWTVDIEEQAIAECREITKDYRDHISYFVDDSTKVISNSKKHIDLLYLDSGNSPDLALSEYKAAENNISEKSIIYIDDTSLRRKRPGGVCKGILVYLYLFKKGWDVVFDNGDQIIMLKGTKDKRNLFEMMKAKMLTTYFYSRVKRRNAF